ncbi:glycosyltransferase involved in cell wall biosynthesis [Pseudomonas sp. TE3786]
MINVGIPVAAGNGWLGGLNYFKSLAYALNQSGTQDVRLTLLTNDVAALEDCAGARVAVKKAAGVFSANKLVRAFNMLLQRNIPLSFYAFKHNVDIVTHFRSNSVIGVPVLFWMPDFQHKYLPEFFSASDCAARDEAVRSSSALGEILFSSVAAQNDFRAFYPDLAAVRSHVLHFAPLISAAKADGAAVDLAQKYGVGQRFFYLPNQFWKHKNHQIVAEALLALPDDFVVVCTGGMEDFRDASHVEQFKAFISNNGLAQRFMMLGLVPRADVYALLEQCIAVINPSFFEGWSTTVEEAKHSGKRLILSDIPVHREQNPDQGLFFSPVRADELASCMKVVVSEFDADVEAGRKARADLAYPEAVKKFAYDYVQIVKSCVRNNDD